LPIWLESLTGSHAIGTLQALLFIDIFGIAISLGYASIHAANAASEEANVRFNWDGILTRFGGVPQNPEQIA